MLKVVVKEYIKSLKETEAKRKKDDPTYTPVHIPNTAELAAHSDVAASHYYKWAGNRTVHIHRTIPGQVVTYLRSLGHNTNIWDILTLETE